MVRTPAQPPSGPPVLRDGDGNVIHNVLLRQVAQKECPILMPVLELVRLRLHQMLHEAGEVIRSVYFLNDGLASILAVLSDGKSVEVGIIGKEGFVGAPAVFGFQTSATRAITQADATAYRVEVKTLRRLLPGCPSLAAALQRYAMIQGSQAMQIAACNRLHEVDERLARWLLMSHDRLGTRTMPLTQDYLGQMLGTRRSTVSTAASILQKAGMITYTRGNVTVVDRARLEEATCECYFILRDRQLAWAGEAGLL